MREENTLDSLPVVTIGNVDRVSESEYRERCVNRLVEIALGLVSGKLKKFITK